MNLRVFTDPFFLRRSNLAFVVDRGCAQTPAHGAGRYNGFFVAAEFSLSSWRLHAESYWRPAASSANACWTARHLNAYSRFAARYHSRLARPGDARRADHRAPLGKAAGRVFGCHAPRHRLSRCLHHYHLSSHRARRTGSEIIRSRERREGGDGDRMADADVLSHLSLADTRSRLGKRACRPPLRNPCTSEHASIYPKRSCDNSSTLAQ